jgi:lipopolysaccharide transport system ATP-binding protein
MHGFRKLEKALQMSSDDVAVSVKNLSKRFELYGNPRDRLKQFVLPRLQRLAGQQPKQYFGEFWALKDVSFEIKKGETVGIIGQNGSGKSTLLQIICGTLSPSSGEVETRGRIAALLELGSGFNPEFTGRENVLMSCALLGMTQKKTEAHFDEIVDFADIGDFINHPVKTYSSGMYVRLAFAVNIVSKPDIMVVDEALAVGDIVFQTKCMTALSHIQKRGSTILFVTHDLDAVRNLCSSALYLNNGKLYAAGGAPDIVDLYLREMRQRIGLRSQAASVNEEKSEGLGGQQLYGSERVYKSCEKFDSRVSLFRHGTGCAKISFVEIQDLEGNYPEILNFDQEVIINIYFTSFENVKIVPYYYIRDAKKNWVLGASCLTTNSRSEIDALAGDRFIVSFTTKLPLQHGVYSVYCELRSCSVALQSGVALDVVEDAIIFQMSQRNPPLESKVYVETKVKIEKAY